MISGSGWPSCLARLAALHRRRPDMNKRPAAGGALKVTTGPEVTLSIPPATHNDTDRGHIPTAPPRGPKAHKEMARTLRIRGNSAGELIVLAPGNDPFYKGTPA